MASPPPTPNDSTTTPKSDAFGGIAVPQYPRSSPFAPASNTAQSTLFNGVAAQQPVIGTESSIFARPPPKNIFGGFGSTQTTTASTTSNVFGNRLGKSNTTGFGVQQAPIPNKGTSAGSLAPYIEKDGSSTRATAEYQTITSVDPYKNYSIEELRAVDYQQGRHEPEPFRYLSDATTCEVGKISASPMYLNGNISTLILLPKSFRISAKQAMQLGRGVITINIGDKEDMHSFTVHEALICSRSNFFRNTLNGNSKEAQEKTVNLPEEDPIIFALYEQLLYSGWIPSDSDTSAFDDIVKEYATLCSLYVLSSKIQDVEAKHVVINALLGMSRTMMLDGQRTCPLLQHVEIIYYGTHGPCAARRLMVDIYTYRASEDWLEKTFPPDFVFDLAKNILGKRRTTIDATLTCEVSDYYDTDEVVEEKL